jgi:hypothetical protein
MMKKDSIATTAILLSLSVNDDLLLAKDESDKQVRSSRTMGRTACVGWNNRREKMFLFSSRLEFVFQWLPALPTANGLNSVIRV